MSRCEVTVWIAVVVALDGLAALAGGLVPDRQLQRGRPVLFGFAAGTLLASGLLELLPEAMTRTGPAAIAYAFGAAAAVGTFEWTTSRRRAHRERPPVSPIALLGSDGLHNFADGIAITAAFLVSPRLGALTSAAVIAHELPEELADYALLRATGLTRRRAMLGLAIAQLTAAFGAASALLASSLLGGVEGVVLALASGTFIYIAVIDLLPELVRTRSRSGFAALIIGVAFALISP